MKYVKDIFDIIYFLEKFFNLYSQKLKFWAFTSRDKLAYLS